MTTWRSDDGDEAVQISPLGWGLVVLRGVPLALFITVCLVILLTVRLLERPLFGLHRPVTPYITQLVCRMAFRFLGIRFRTRGKVMSHPGAIVANHASWLDIFTLNARARIYFVSKSEVSGWPGIGTLARATGTVFIDRDPRQARAQTELFQNRLHAGHKLLFFPEGTSSDGMQVLPFKTTLFAAFMTPQLRDEIWVQPVAVKYHAPKGQPDRFYGWWGDMGFGPHLLKTLAACPQGSVEVLYMDPVRVADFADRKALAAYCEARVREGHADLSA
jgi:1-acyl-sn-glycerol-3-phosphate acyltransferase